MMTLTINDYLAILRSCKNIWATSYTVDEHEAWGAFWQLLNGNINKSNCYLRYHQSSFRRSGNGVLSRECIYPNPVSKGFTTIATYHPKLLLAKLANDTFKLIISTANIATDDFRHTTNVAVALDVTEKQANFIKEWIRKAPDKNRAFNFHYTNGKFSIIDGDKNEPSFKQILRFTKPCTNCKEKNKWLIASPFWSASIFNEVFNHNENSEVTAYFRNQSTLDNVSRHKSVNKNADKIKAYTLKDNGSEARWHQKVLAWRCCQKPGANAIIYLGSSNATASGMTGINNVAVNWESGLIETGKADDIWEKAECLAKAGLRQGRKLPIKKKNDLTDDNSEWGFEDINDIKSAMSPFVYASVKIDKESRTITKLKNLKSFSLFGKKWEIKDLHVIEDNKSKQWRNERSIIRKDSFAQLIASIQSDNSILSDDSRDNFTILVDIIELDPEPEKIDIQKINSIRSAKNILNSYLYRIDSPNEATDAINNSQASESGSEDVRFPFTEFFECQQKHPDAAKSWLVNVIGKQGIFQNVPEHWTDIAMDLQNA
jgi:hypothetical protein